MVWEKVGNLHEKVTGHVDYKQFVIKEFLSFLVMFTNVWLLKQKYSACWNQITFLKPKKTNAGSIYFFKRLKFINIWAMLNYKWSFLIKLIYYETAECFVLPVGKLFYFFWAQNPLDRICFLFSQR